MGTRKFVCNYFHDAKPTLRIPAQSHRAGWVIVHVPEGICHAKRKENKGTLTTKENECMDTDRHRQKKKIAEGLEKRKKRLEVTDQ